MSEPLSHRAAAVDVFVVLAAIVVAWLVSKWVLYPALAVPDNAPVILRPITGFLVAWGLLHRRGQGWHSLGLRAPDAWWLAIVGCIALYLVNLALSRWIVPMLAQWLHAQPQAPFIGYVRGNTIAFLGWLGIGIVVGGFFEELLFRGFLQNRIAEIFDRGYMGLTLGIVGQAVIFGALHLYAGAFGFVYAAVFAVVNGVFYLLLRRNLWPLIFVHAAVDSAGIWEVYTS